jgi:superfamily II DNA or RNA helicase
MQSARHDNQALTLRHYQSDIVRKINNTWASGKKRPLVCLPTGSGKTILAADLAYRVAENNKTSWFVVHRRELLKQTVETFDIFNIPRERVKIGMVRSILGKGYPKPDLIIFDECHHLGAKTWRNIVEAYPEAHLVGLTATPARLDGKSLGDVFDALIIGPTTPELIELGYLSPYRMIVADIADLKGLKTRGADFAPEDAAERMMVSAVYGDVVKTYKKYGKQQAIYFCTTIEHSEATAKSFREAGIVAEHFDGKTPTKKRDQLIEDFKNGKIQILSNCELIGEGFDMPACDVVGMLRPTQSLTIYLQQVGRALRPREGKTATIIDHVGNINRHGSPSEPREWTLDGKIKTGRAVTEDGEFYIRYCMNCFAAYEVSHQKCPVCGEEYERTREEIENIKEVKMRILQEEELEKERCWAISPEAEDKARSYSDFCTIAKHRGYKKGWAYHRAKSRGFWTPY